MEMAFNVVAPPGNSQDSYINANEQNLPHVASHPPSSTPFSDTQSHHMEPTTKAKHLMRGPCCRLELILLELNLYGRPSFWCVLPTDNFLAEASDDPVIDNVNDKDDEKLVQDQSTVNLIAFPKYSERILHHSNKSHAKKT